MPVVASMWSVMEPQLSADILVTAYSQGVFPMADRRGQIAWFCPDPRAVIDFDRFHVPKTLGQLCRQEAFKVTVDEDFEGVIRACADRAEGTWISDDFIQAFFCSVFCCVCSEKFPAVWVTSTSSAACCFHG